MPTTVTTLGSYVAVVFMLKHSSLSGGRGDSLRLIKYRCESASFYLRKVKLLHGRWPLCLARPNWTPPHPDGSKSSILGLTIKLQTRQKRLLFIGQIAYTEIGADFTLPKAENTPFIQKYTKRRSIVGARSNHVILSHPACNSIPLI